VSGRGAVVITGASTGIGRACALHLDNLGFQVFPGVRKEADGDALRSEASERLTPLLVDVADQASIEAAADTVTRTLDGQGLAGLVNNAGITVTAPLEFVPIDELRHQLEVNVIGQVAVTQAFLALLRKARGRIVNVSSIGGRVALPFLGPYAASKFAVEGLSDSLRRELRPWGIEVSVIEPGSVATPIWEKGVAAGDRLLEQMPPEGHALYGESVAKLREVAAATARRGMPPEEVARTVERALTAPKPKTRYLVGRDAKVRARMKSVLPDRAFDRLIARALGG
jgi:NAD(P)-dependent dehydrogenase (short-subunit alcohol dehydrogenase family)